MAMYIREDLRAYKWWLYAAGLILLAGGGLLATYLVTNRPTGQVVVTPASGPQVTGQLPAPPEPAPQVQEASSPTVDQSVDTAIAQAMIMLDSDPMKLVEVRDRLNALLSGTVTSQQAKLIKTKLSQLADKWLFGPSVYPSDRLCQTYKVQPGDQLRVISQRCKVPHELLMTINHIPRPEALRAGQYIKIVNGPFHATVSRSNFTMDIYLQDTYVCTYQVGLGRPGYETPTGLWIVKPGGKLIKPQWTDPDTGRTYRPEDPDYPLGSRWIGLEGIEGQAVGREGFAIHGTNDPNQIGQPGSRGCIRLHNGDAVMVYNMLMPGQSKVRVMD